MEVFRITQEIFSEDLSGDGAKLFGGRWNSVGIPALYAASSRSLALLETLAHTPAKMLQLKTYILSTILIPDSALQQIISFEELPNGWDDTDIHDYTAKAGDRFIQANKRLLLAVPSVIMPEENIYVINSAHTDMKKVKILHKRVLRFDRRVENHLQ